MPEDTKEKGKNEEKKKDRNRTKLKCTNLEIKDVLKLIMLLLDVFLSSTVLIKFFSVENNYNQRYQAFIDDVGQIVQVSQEEINADMESIKQTIVSSNVQNITNNNAPMINEEMDGQTLIKYAENAFLAEDYKSAIQIYSMENLSDNPVACNNMGYMFANGIYFPLNMEMADYYYDKAIELGDVKAYENKLAMHFKYCCDDLVAMIQQGFDMENQKMIEFVTSHIESYEDYTWDQKENIAAWLLTVVSEEGQQELLEKFYVWEDKGYVFLRYSPEDTEVVKYIWISSDINDEGTVHTYKKYEKRCVGIEILEEGLEFLD